MNKHIASIPPALRWAGGLAVLGLVAAFEPAISQSGGFSLPYSGDAAASGSAVVSFTNDATSGAASDGLYGFTNSSDPASVGVYGASLGGSGVYGYANSGGSTSGVYGLGDGGSGSGVYGLATNNYGVFGQSNGSNGNGAITSAGILGTGGASTAVGVVGKVTSVNSAIMAVNGGSGAGLSSQSVGGYGVYGVSGGTNGGSVTAAGVYGYSASGTGTAGISNSAGNPGVYGYNNTGNGIYGQSDGANGIYGASQAASYAGVYGANFLTSGVGIGVQGQSASPSGYAGLFQNTAASGYAVALQAAATSPTGYGVVGIGRGGSGASGGAGIYGINTNGGNAGYFLGNVQATGTITGAAKNFKIDHPLDPAHKFLVHSCVESSEMLNTYSGNATLDSDGRVTIQMPEWFQAENGDFRYQLTCVGGFAPVYVAQELQSNRFEIAGGKAGMKISWQVTGARQDAYARAHPLQVEQAKTGSEQGKYLDPVEYGRPASEGIGVLPASLAPIPRAPMLTTRLVPANPLRSLRISAPKPGIVAPCHPSRRRASNHACSALNTARQAAVA